MRTFGAKSSLLTPKAPRHSRNDAYDPPDEPLPDLPVVVGEPGLWRARRIGRAWLRAHPEEADRSALERMLAPLPDALRRVESLRDPGVLEWLRERQRADFAADRIVELERWWLSQTEARLCAYLSLS